MEIRLSSPYRSELRHRGSPVWTWSLSEHAAKWAIAIFHSIQSHLEHYLTSSLTETSLVWRNELFSQPFPTWKDFLIPVRHYRSRKVLRKLIRIRIWAVYGVPLNTQLTTLIDYVSFFWNSKSLVPNRNSPSWSNHAVETRPSTQLERNQCSLPWLLANGSYHVRPKSLYSLLSLLQTRAHISFSSTSSA